MILYFRKQVQWEKKSRKTEKIFTESTLFLPLKSVNRKVSQNLLKNEKYVELESYFILTRINIYTRIAKPVRRKLALLTH